MVSNAMMSIQNCLPHFPYRTEARPETVTMWLAGLSGEREMRRVDIGRAKAVTAPASFQRADVCLAVAQFTGVGSAGELQF